MSELKPCPFCGSSNVNDTVPPSEDKSIRLGCDRWICPDCAASGPAGLYIEECTEGWNSRPSPWVSVNDRLPEDGQYLCLTDDIESPLGNVCLSRYTTKVAPNWEAERHRHSLITHWMPLPEAPEDKEILPSPI